MLLQLHVTPYPQDPNAPRWNRDIKRHYAKKHKDLSMKLQGEAMLMSLAELEAWSNTNNTGGGKFWKSQVSKLGSGITLGRARRDPKEDVVDPTLGRGKREARPSARFVDAADAATTADLPAPKKQRATTDNGDSL